MDRVKRIETTLQQAFAPQRLVIEDESAQHAGHAGAAAGGGHFRVLIVADAFRGQDRVRRHGAVYAALGDLMRVDIHALALRTLTPEEWQASRPGK
jgi:BolA protein